MLLAAYWRYERLVAELITWKVSFDHPDEDGWRPIYAAYDAPAIIKLILDKDQTQIYQETKSGDTVLHLSVRFEEEESVRLLLERNANTLTANHQGDTPLHLAAMSKK